VTSVQLHVNVDLCVYVFISGRYCVFSQFSPNHSQLLLAAYSPSAKVRHRRCHVLSAVMYSLTVLTLKFVLWTS